ncbi:PaaI family thioesterase [Blastococcus litoris]|uniref:PaaI family thioesterase n=1 Tax=Blastococcus litoris TaxID=2171622 RepID=UPI000E30A439|nr:PaaI family thioesterase [Blastococcus litoris]
MPSDSMFDSRVSAVLGIPLHRFLGMELQDPDDPSAGIWFPVAGPTLNPGGLLHAGVIYTLMDVACFLALIRHLEDDEHAVTHDITVSLLRPVSPDKRVDITGTVLRRGRTIAFMRADATVDGQVVAAASVTKSVVRAG